MDTELTRGLARERGDQPILRAVKPSTGEIDLTDESGAVLDLTVRDARDALFSTSSGRTIHVPDRDSETSERPAPTGLRRFLRRRPRML